MNIVAADRVDLPELAAFARSTYATAFGAELGAKALQQHLESNMSDQDFEQMWAVDTFYVARRDAKLVGFGQVGLVDPGYATYADTFDPSGAELRRLYVQADAQSMGVGSQLMRRILEDPSVVAANALYLTTWESNTGAQKFYVRHHFSKIGQIPEYDEDGTLVGYEHLMARG